MGGRYRTPGGWTVEVVYVGGPAGPAAGRLRMRHHGFYIADVETVAGLADWIPASELERLEPGM